MGDKFPPLYSYSFNEARKQNRLDLWQVSHNANIACKEAIDSILSAMQIGMELAKKKNKEKYTPKKYKKD